MKVQSLFQQVGGQHCTEEEEGRDSSVSGETLFQWSSLLGVNAHIISAVLFKYAYAILQPTKISVSYQKLKGKG